MWNNNRLSRQMNFVSGANMQVMMKLNVGSFVNATYATGMAMLQLDAVILTSFVFSMESVRFHPEDKSDGDCDNQL